MGKARFDRKKLSAAQTLAYDRVAAAVGIKISKHRYVAIAALSPDDCRTVAMLDDWDINIACALSYRARQLGVSDVHYLKNLVEVPALAKRLYSRLNYYLPQLEAAFKIGSVIQMNPIQENAPLVETIPAPAQVSTPSPFNALPSRPIPHINLEGENIGDVPAPPVVVAERPRSSPPAPVVPQIPSRRGDPVEKLYGIVQQLNDVPVADIGDEGARKYVSSILEELRVRTFRLATLMQAQKLRLPPETYRE